MGAESLISIRYSSELFTIFLTGRIRALEGVGTLLHGLFPRSVSSASLIWDGCFDFGPPSSHIYTFKGGTTGALRLLDCCMSALPMERNVQ